MQVLQDGLIMGSLITSFFLGKEQLSFNIDSSKLQHNRRFLTDYNEKDAKFLLELSLAVSTARGKPIAIPDWLQDTEIWYSKCPVNITGMKYPQILAHVLYAKVPNVAIIVFTGTYNLCLAGVDMAYRQVESEDLTNYTPGMKVHGGFYKTYMDIREQLVGSVKKLIDEHNPQIVIAGHSLGAALSHICALDLAYYEPIHYAFAAPLVFNPLAAESFDNLVSHSFRISNVADVITHSPYSVMPNGNMFNRTSNSIEFQSNLGSFTDNHTLAYIKHYDIDVSL